MTKQVTNFAEILSKLRDQGFNDYKMAELTGVDRTMLTRLRTGKRKQPNYDDGAEIMKIYNKNIK